MDWMTLTIELIGVAILFVFIVIPIQEFREIFKGLLVKQQSASANPLTPGGDLSDRN